MGKKEGPAILVDRAFSLPKAINFLYSFRLDHEKNSQTGMTDICLEAKIKMDYYPLCYLLIDIFCLIIPVHLVYSIVINLVLCLSTL